MRIVNRSHQIVWYPQLKPVVALGHALRPVARLPDAFVLIHVATHLNTVLLRHFRAISPSFVVHDCHLSASHVSV